MIDQQSIRTMATAVNELERDGEIVVTSPSIERLAEKLAEAALKVVPSTGLSFAELVCVRSLIPHAAWNKQFVDWEMPTLTGFKADEFERIAGKLPRG